ncbi:MAG: glycosyltransferase [Elusimicrobia bacterium]|nr:glycosyltransferase [Elusimicrobiota bacterium]
MNAPVKVVHLTEGLIDPKFRQWGGMQRSLAWLAEFQKRHGFEPEIWVLERMSEVPPGFPITVRTIPAWDHRRPDHVLRLAARLRGSGARVLHTHGYWAGALGRPAAWAAGVPARVHKVASAYRAEYRWTHRMTERLLSRITSRVIAVSDDVKHFLVRDVGVREEKIVVIANGTPEPAMPQDRAAHRAFFGFGPRDFVVASLSRLAAGKGLEDLVMAASRLGTSEPRPRLLIAGDGPLRRDLERQAASLLGEGGGRFLGWVDDVGRVLGAADAFVLGSEEREGFSTALVQALAARLPVVATRVGGNVEAIEDGVSGLLVAPNDRPGLAAALASLRDSLDLRRTLGAAGRARYEERYRIETTARRVCDLYGSLLG